MREPVAEMVGQSGREDLRFILEPSKRSRVDYPVAISLEFVAIRMGLFGITPAEGAFNRKLKPRKHTFRKHFSACQAAKSS